ncbi:unnamed protein product [Microthlaspi erraticum]|uniref:DUF4283 domain-containing protein n=2 Tax=Microthlaspi erraticum TaxID=1685480 RepID=A0A6D2KB99_9BRAS|nr:unnamed protein product [Microthlaspi erraticum]
MSAAMDRAMMAMSIKEEDLPVEIPNRPEYCSKENNALSMIDRVLNPKCQNVAHLIVDLPRKWGKAGRIRGVVLSNESFQFFFKTEHDLEEIMDKGVQSFNEWAVVMERWVEKEPPEFLQFVPLWVQIRELPLNHYRSQTIWDIGDVLGVVKEIAFDETKNQSHPYVRVKVIFNVARPLRKAKMVNLPDGEQKVVHFFYEQIKKRCYNCKRLNHEKDICPLLVKESQEMAAIRRAKSMAAKREANLVLRPSDPLYGVLKEEQVGVNPLTGRPKIDPAVLEDMRQYLVANTGDELLVKHERLRSSIAEVEADPIAQKIILRMEARPLVSQNLDKEKGKLFDFETGAQAKECRGEDKLIRAAINQGQSDMVEYGSDDLRAKLESLKSRRAFTRSTASFTAYGSGLDEAGPSRVTVGKKKLGRDMSKDSG